MTRAADAAKRRRASFVFGTCVFIAHPAHRALYMKTHVCVVMVACPHCRAVVNEPCRSVRLAGRYRETKRPKHADWTPANGWTSDTHYMRRNLALRGAPENNRTYHDARGRLRNRKTK